MEKSFHIADLIVRKIEGRITSSEQQELEQWISADPENRQVYERATNPKEQLGKLEVYRLFNKDRVRSRLEDELFGPPKTIQLNARRIFRYAAAILLPVLMAGAATFYFLRSPEEITLAELDEVFNPGTEKAVLILSDGRQVALETETAISNIQEGKAVIKRNEKQLVYSMQDQDLEPGAELIYNELHTPNGGSYSIQLSDETNIWLNAGSTLRFPATFSDTIREVFLEGEAYFEVSHTGQPFIVHTPRTDTRVLGTSFNITAYEDEDRIVTTLVEGSVRVDASGEGEEGIASAILVPNEQARFDKSAGSIEKVKVDASGFTSWISGKMEFHNETLENVMKKLSRWYDFDYRFENEAAKHYHFSARLDRDQAISTILEMMEMTTNVEFSADQEIIVIK